MALYSGNADARLSCSDSSYDERNLSSSEGENDVSSDEDSEDVEDSSEVPLGLEPYQYEPVGSVGNSSTLASGSESEDEATWRLNNTSWYVFKLSLVLETR